MNNTKLFKIFNKRNCFFVISLVMILNACSEENVGEKEPSFLLGKWKFTSIETRESQAMDSISHQVYKEQLAAFITESAFIFKDSTYQYDLGGNKENGLWKYHPVDSVLSLKSQNSIIQMFKVTYTNNTLKLYLKNSLSGEYWLLKK